MPSQTVLRGGLTIERILRSRVRLRMVYWPLIALMPTGWEERLASLSSDRTSARMGWGTGGKIWNPDLLTAA
jgi:hypothetical protein